MVKQGPNPGKRVQMAFFVHLEAWIEISGCLSRNPNPKKLHFFNEFFFCPSADFPGKRVQNYLKAWIEISGCLEEGTTVAIFSFYLASLFNCQNSLEKGSKRHLWPFEA